MESLTPNEEVKQKNELKTVIQQSEDKKNVMEKPVFNKRLFHATKITVTQKSKDLMQLNEALLHCHKIHLSKSDLLSLQSIVEGLRLIHHDISYVKTCLAHCVTFEHHEAGNYVHKWPHEDVFSCYFVLHGVVQATYKSNDGIASIYESGKVYFHGEGELVSFLSSMIEEEDFQHIDTLQAKSKCDLIRVDRSKFNSLIKEAREQDYMEKKEFLNSGISILSQLNDTVKEEIICKLILETYRINKIILRQGETTHWIYFIKKGRCQAVRSVNNVLIGLWSLEKGDNFGEESFFGERSTKQSHLSSSSVYVQSTSEVTIYKLDHSELELSGRTNLVELLKNRRVICPSDNELLKRYLEETDWKSYCQEKLETLLDKDSRNKRNRFNRRKSAFAVMQISRSGETASECDKNIKTVRACNQNPQIKVIPANSTNNQEKRNFRFAEVVDTNFSKALQRPKSVDLSTKCTLDSREIHRKFKIGPCGGPICLAYVDKSNDKEEDFRNNWLQTVEALEENLLFSGILKTTSSEIIKKAQEETRLQAEKVRRLKEALGNEIIWESGLVQDLKEAKSRLAFNKYRNQIIKKNIEVLQKKKIRKSAKMCSKWTGELSCPQTSIENDSQLTTTTQTSKFVTQKNKKSDFSIDLSKIGTRSSSSEWITSNKFPPPNSMHTPEPPQVKRLWNEVKISARFLHLQKCYRAQTTRRLSELNLERRLSRQNKMNNNLTTEFV